MKIKDTGEYIENQFTHPGNDNTDDCPFDADGPEPAYHKGSHHDTIWEHLCFEAEVPTDQFDKFRDKFIHERWPKCGAFKTTLLKNGSYYVVGYDTEAQLIKWESNQPGPLGAVEDH